ncbi:MAG: hypothetical protein ABI321_14830 [Polyangia bacterium]
MLLDNALSAFVVRGTHGRRGVLLVYSALGTAALFLLSMVVSARAAEDHSYIDPLALADMLAMIFVACTLLVVAPAVVAAQVGEERRAGTLDLLRTAPLSPTMLAAGFVVGAPGGVYLLSAGPLALHCVATVFGRVPVASSIEAVLILGVGGVMLMLVSMLASLTMARTSNAGAAPMMIVGVLAMGALISVAMVSGAGSTAWAFVHPAGALASVYEQFPGPFQDALLSSYQLAQLKHGSASAWQVIEPLFALLVYAVGSGFMLVAARRALAGDPPAQLTKTEAVGLFALATFAVLVPLRATQVGAIEHDLLAISVLSLVPAYVLCVLASTPSAVGYGDGSASGLSSRGAPLTAAALMIATIAFMSLAIFGTAALRVFHTPGALGFSAAFAGLALTLPIYALFVVTRVTTTAGRLAIVAALSVHFVAQLFAWTFGIDLAYRELQHGEEVPVLLAHLGMVFGIVLPALVAWRQRASDLALRSA